jgi:hypothetical protein
MVTKMKIIGLLGLAGILATSALCQTPTYVKRAGDTMTGPLTLPGDPTQPLQAVTKAYADAHIGGTFTLTTNGTSGAASFNGSILNIPVYAGSSYVPPTGTGFFHITAGVADTSARAVDVSSADITGVLKTAAIPAFSGDISNSAGSSVTSLTNTNANPGTCGDATHVGQPNLTSKGLATACSPVAIQVMTPSGTGHHGGFVPDPGATAGTTRYLREDNTWDVPSGTGSGTNPTADGVQFWTEGSGSWAPATAAQLTTVLDSDTVNSSSQVYSTGSGGDSTCPTPTAGKDSFCMKAGVVQYAHGAGAYAPLVPAQAYATLTDGATLTWNTAGSPGSNATLTLINTTTTRTLNLTGLVSGAGGTLILKEDATGVAGTFNLGSGCTWYIGGSSGFTAASTLTLTSTANAINILAFTYDGTNCYGNLR